MFEPKISFMCQSHPLHVVAQVHAVQVSRRYSIGSEVSRTKTEQNSTVNGLHDILKEKQGETEVQVGNANHTSGYVL